MANFEKQLNKPSVQKKCLNHCRDLSEALFSECEPVTIERGTTYAHLVKQYEQYTALPINRNGTFAEILFGLYTDISVLFGQYWTAKPFECYSLDHQRDILYKRIAVFEFVFQDRIRSLEQSWLERIKNKIYTASSLSFKGTYNQRQIGDEEQNSKC